MATVLFGYAPSPVAVAAMSVAAQLLPDTRVWMAHVWRSPTHPAELRRLAIEAGSVDVLTRQLDETGMADAVRVAASGVALASALGLTAEPVTQRCFADLGDALVQLARELRPDVVVVGSRGLRGARAISDSVSDVVAHRSDRPVLVVPAALPSDYFTRAADGPVIVGWDGTPGAVSALATAERLFDGRRCVAVEVGPQSTDECSRRVVVPAAQRSTGLDARDVDVVTVDMRGRLPHGRAVSRALVEYADKQHAALLVVGSRRRAAAAEILLGSVAVATLHHSGLPVLVVPPQQDLAVG